MSCVGCVWFCWLYHHVNISFIWFVCFDCSSFSSVSFPICPSIWDIDTNVCNVDACFSLAEELFDCDDASCFSCNSIFSVNISLNCFFIFSLQKTVESEFIGWFLLTIKSISVSFLNLFSSFSSLFTSFSPLFFTSLPISLFFSVSPIFLFSSIFSFCLTNTNCLSIDWIYILTLKFIHSILYNSLTKPLLNSLNGLLICNVSSSV